MSGPDYQPPTSADMASRQNSTEVLRLLLAQRKLNSRSKRWLSLRLCGVMIIAIAAPVLAVVVPVLATTVGAIAGLWIFLSRTVFIGFEKRRAAEAASVQEKLDFTIYGMPDSGARSSMPSLEAIVVLTGKDIGINSAAQEEKLIDWYEIDRQQDGLVTIALCQRANASYSDRLYKLASNTWLSVLCAWIVGLCIFSVVTGLSLELFLLGIVFPVLPALLDAYEYWVDIKRAATERRDLVAAIEDKLRSNAANLDTDDVLVWQERLYELRRSVPQVPDFIYWLTREKNEIAMSHTAAELSRNIRRGNN